MTNLRAKYSWNWLIGAFHSTFSTHYYAFHPSGCHPDPILMQEPISTNLRTWLLYLFPVTAQTINLKLSGLQQQVFGLSSFSHSSGGQNSNKDLTRLQSRCGQEACIPSGSSRRESLSWLFQPLEAAHVLSFPAPSSSSKPAMAHLALFTSHHPPPSFALPGTFKNTDDYVGPTLIIQNALPIVKSAN